MRRPRISERESIGTRPSVPTPYRCLQRYTYFFTRRISVDETLHVSLDVRVSVHDHRSQHPTVVFNVIPTFSLGESPPMRRSMYLLARQYGTRPSVRTPYRCLQRFNYFFTRRISVDETLHVSLNVRVSVHDHRSRHPTVVFNVILTFSLGESPSMRRSTGESPLMRCSMYLMARQYGTRPSVPTPYRCLQRYTYFFTRRISVDETLHVSLNVRVSVHDHRSRHPTVVFYVILFQEENLR
ncbi:hypothetical protein J6590_006659 [Homalodisca vitripennis]|nr:hypothetical protein J6590_006659 [Homalodisca vitripennis]